MQFIETNPKPLLVALASGASLILAAQQAEGAKTFYIDEVTDYTGNGCPNDDLNTVTYYLWASMVNAGWSGERWLNADAWPQDFREACSSTYGSGGLDSSYPDTKSLAVFGGHGNVGLLSYGYKHNNLCNHDFGSNMRLGSMGGATAAHAMWLSCDALQVSSLPSEANWSWVWQQFGWRNTIGIADNEPALFFDLTATQVIDYQQYNALTNADAWLAWMGGDGRQPIVVSYGSSSSGCWAVHDSHKLKSNVGNAPRPGGPSCGQGQPTFYYCYEYL